MRLFVAVDLDPPARGAAFAVGERLALALRSAEPAGRPAVSWVREDHLHLTLRFLGEVDEARAGDLTARFGEVLVAAPFEIELGGVGVFPPAGPPRVIWLGVDRGAEQLATLSSELERRFVAWGFGRADRPFRAHLTLGRCRAPLGPHAREILTCEGPRAVGSSRVDRAVLYQSTLSPAGPTYVALARASLSG